MTHVVAHSNIALAKYWGKREGAGNVPAVPSLSVTLAGMTTKTEIAFDGSCARDELFLNGALVDSKKATDLLDVVRREAGISDFARIVTTNDFPTASGLASSASGFAALALAATREAGLDWPLVRIADLARRSSASAARSLVGGFVALEGEIIRQVAPAAQLDLRVLVCVTTEAPKSTSSTDGMRETARVSPYYSAWLDDAPKTFARLEAALLASDFPEVGRLAEGSALAMHACAMAAGIVYVTGPTLAALAEVRALRRDGIEAYATIDAGPHLKCLVLAKDAPAVASRLAAVAGVLRMIETAPGEGARVIS